jgi:hypothetical protein
VVPYHAVGVVDNLADIAELDGTADPSLDDRASVGDRAG